MKKCSLFAIVIVMLLCMGCGAAGTAAKGDAGNGEPKNAAASVVGSYVFHFTDEVNKQLERDDDTLKALQAKAAAGDRASQAALAQIPKNPLTQRQLLAGISLRLTSDDTFDFRLRDRRTGRMRHATGTYAVDDSGAKLTLTFQSIDGKKAEGADAKTLSMTFDPDAHTLTGETGSGPKLVMQKQ